MQGTDAALAILALYPGRLKPALPPPAACACTHIGSCFPCEVPAQQACEFACDSAQVATRA